MTKTSLKALRELWERKKCYRDTKKRDPGNNLKFSEEIEASLKRLSEEIDLEMDSLFDEKQERPAGFQTSSPSKPK